MTPEERAKRIVQTWDHFENYPELRDIIATAIRASVEEARAEAAEDAKAYAHANVKAERRRLIPRVCVYCHAGDMPVRRKAYQWIHDMPPERRWYCDASPIYEALRESAMEEDDANA